jgi:hypothetical protein
MEARNERNVGLLTTAAGLAVVVLAVLLFGLTTASGELDWVSIITALAGLVIVGTGLYRGCRNKGKGPTQTGPTPHTAS